MYTSEYISNIHIARARMCRIQINIHGAPQGSGCMMCQLVHAQNMQIQAKRYNTSGEKQEETAKIKSQYHYHFHFFFFWTMVLFT